MAKSLEFARTHWAMIANKRSVRHLRERFASTLNLMDYAVRDRDLNRARASAAAELALVDELEGAFRPPGQQGVLVETGRPLV